MAEIKQRRAECIRTCDHCGVRFEAKRELARFCSTPCQQADYYARHGNVLVADRSKGLGPARVRASMDRNCLSCGEPFRASRSDSYWCSPKHRDAWHWRQRCKAERFIEEVSNG